MNWSLFPINLKYGISTNERLVEVFSVNHTNTIFKIASLLLMGKSIWTHSVSVDLATVMSVVRPYVETLVTNSWGKRNGSTITYLSTYLKYHKYSKHCSETYQPILNCLGIVNIRPAFQPSVHTVGISIRYMRYELMAETLEGYNWYLLSLLKCHLQLYPCPTNVNYLWNLGFILLTSMILQIISGISLALHYTSDINESYYSVIQI
jgi:hypothetical protein